MKMHRTKLLAAAGLGIALTLVSGLSWPTNAAGFEVLGGSLSLSRRDFRVWNNFTDVTANNNTVPHVNFPGQTGAVMAIWKGQEEWSSGPYAGNGQGDGLPTTNANIGDGGANFDNTFQGTSTSQTSNTHFEIPGSGGSVLAFTTGGGTGPWQISYYASWTWQDGPGSVTSGVDLQGVACHEIGHSLGLGHSNTNGATMFPSISGTGTPQRSLETDDKNGIQAVYGVKSASKPLITSLTGSKQIGQSLIINGSNFTAANNEVWFTKSASNGVPIKVLGAASTLGGTKITVTVPFGIQDGDVLVKNDNGTTGANLSNPFPIDIASASGNPPFLTSVVPGTGAAGGFDTVVLNGAGFTGTTSVLFGANGAVSFTVNSDVKITAVTPPGDIFSSVSVTVNDNEGTTNLPSGFFYSVNPFPQITGVSPNSGPMTGGTLVTITGPSVVGVADVTFNGVSGTDLEIVTANQLIVTTPPGPSGPVNVTAFEPSSGMQSTIVNGFTYNFAAGQFIMIEPGVSGSLGQPVLAGSGDLTPGSGTGFTITTSNALGSAPAAMFFSLSQSALPFKGGTLYAFPMFFTLSTATAPSGQIILPIVMPLSAPSGTTLVCQTWIKDTSGPVGVTASNGLKMITP